MPVPARRTGTFRDTSGHRARDGPAVSGEQPRRPIEAGPLPGPFVKPYEELAALRDTFPEPVVIEVSTLRLTPFSDT